MAAPARTPRLPASGPTPAAGKIFSLSDISSTSKPLPSRWGLYAINGFGKTSLWAHAPSPIFIQTQGETGLETLISAGQLPPTPHFPEIGTWAELTAALRTLQTEEHAYKTLVIDTANGAERMLHEYVCQRDYNGDWDSKEYGFLAWGGKGFETSLADWRLFLSALDKLRIERGMTIALLVHTKVNAFKNPSGADFYKYTPDMHEKTWGLTRGWLDNTLFGNFEVTVMSGAKETRSDRKGKAAESSARILYTSSDNPVFDAKNRLGLPAEIEMGDSPATGWLNLTNAIKESRKQVTDGK